MWTVTATGDLNPWRASVIADTLGISIEDAKKLRAGDSVSVKEEIHTDHVIGNLISAVKFVKATKTKSDKESEG